MIERLIPKYLTFLIIGLAIVVSGFFILVAGREVLISIWVDKLFDGESDTGLFKAAQTAEQAIGHTLTVWFFFGLTGIPQIKPTFLEIAPSGIPSNIIPHSKGVKCGLIRSNSPFSYSNHRPAKPKIPKPLVYAQVSPLGTSFATP